MQDDKPEAKNLSAIAVYLIVLIGGLHILAIVGFAIYRNWVLYHKLVQF